MTQAAIATLAKLTAAAVIEGLRASQEVHTLADSIPTTCTIMDLCRILQQSRGTIYAHLKDGTCPIQELEPRIGQPRFPGAEVKAYLERRAAPRRRR